MTRNRPDLPRIGVHLPLAGGMLVAADRAIEIGATAIQVFGDNPTAWRRRAGPPTELPAFRERLAANGVEPVAIHASYLVNLAGPDPAFFEGSIGLLQAELASAEGYGARFVNVHVGSHRDAGVDAGVARVAEGLRRTLDGAPDDPAAAMLVLENSAGGGFGLGSTIEELAAIADAVAASRVAPERVGFCLDAAHAWSAGFAMDRPDGVDALLESFDRRIGLDRLVMVHLNDSKSERGSNLDRHEHVGAGRIGEVGLGHLVRHPSLRRVAFYCETPGMDQGYDRVNVERAFDLLAGRPLRPLPPGAMRVRSASRSRSAPAPEPA
jgi:deoxyribonuclease IV